MRKFLLLINFYFFMNLAFGQVTFSPNPVEISATADNEDIQVDFEVKNDGADTLQLAWKLEIVDQPEDWQYYVCDTEVCYNFNQDESSTERPNILNPSSSIIVMFHTFPTGIAGEGSYKISFYDVANPDSTLVEVPITVNSVTTSTKNISTKGLSLFPNPAEEFFRINTGDQISTIDVTSITGKKIISYKAELGKYYDISSLLPGMYFARLLDDKENVVKVIKLKKRS